MASAIIHIAVAKKVNDIINRNKKDLYLGAIAPDAAKIIGIDRNITHFIKEDNVDTPNIAYFKQLYLDKIKSDYDLGYYIHLLTDELWFSEFLPNFVLDDETIIDPSGEKVSLVGITIGDIIYNDYTNLNAKIIDYYNLDLKLFYEEFEYPSPTIKEVPECAFPQVIDKMGLIIANSTKYNYILKLDKITHFVEYATVYVLEKLTEDNLI